MMLAFACDPGATFDDLCRQIADRDPTKIAGPLVEHLLGPLAVVFAVVVAGRLLGRFVERATPIKSNPQVLTLVHNLLTVSTYVFAALAGLVAAGLSISVLLTFGGLFSLAIGLAFQDVLRNLLAGIFLLIEQPFRIGDVISVHEHSGTVETIQLRTTALRTADGQLAIMPNLLAFNGLVVNRSAFPTRQYSVSVRVARGRDVDEAMRQARAILSATKAIAKKPTPAVVPQVDGEAVMLHCRYWMDYRAFDPDKIAGEVAGRLVPLGLETA